MSQLSSSATMAGDDAVNGRSSDAPFSTAPASPPKPTNEAPNTAGQSLSRKRSHEEMNEDSKAQYESSTIAVDDDDSVGQRNKPNLKDTDSSKSRKSSANSSNGMPPPATPRSKTETASQKVPRSGQGSQAVDTSQPNKGQRDTASSRNLTGDQTTATSDEDDTVDASDPTSPQEKILDFDWEDLEQRYHDRIQQLRIEEEGIMMEFNGLCDYFSVWAAAGSHQEIERTFKRFKTQTTLVQHHEDELEKKRLHYVKVVDAFKSALELLAS